MDKKLNEAVAALRPQMVAALQRLVRRCSVEADPLPGKPFGEEVDACFAEALTLCHELGFETTDMDRYIGWCEIGSGDEMVAVLGHLDVVPEVLFRRLKIAKSKRPLLAGKDDAELMSFILSALEKRKAFYEQADYRFDAQFLESREQIADSVAAMKNLLDKE